MTPSPSRGDGRRERKANESGGGNSRHLMCKERVPKTASKVPEIVLSRENGLIEEKEMIFISGNAGVCFGFGVNLPSPNR